jgi:hypothetical protein
MRVTKKPVPLPVIGEIQAFYLEFDHRGEAAHPLR